MDKCKVLLSCHKPDPFSARHPLIHNPSCPITNSYFCYRLLIYNLKIKSKEIHRIWKLTTFRLLLIFRGRGKDDKNSNKFSVKGQIVNILVSSGHTQLLWQTVLFIQFFSLTVLHKQAVGKI